MKRTLLHYAEKLKKPLHILTAFAVIICTAFSVPSFASSYIGNNFIVLSKYDNSSTTELSYSNYDFIYVYSGRAITYGFNSINNTDDIYVFYTQNPNNSNEYNSYVVSPVRFDSISSSLYFRYVFNTVDSDPYASPSEFGKQTIYDYDSTTGLYYSGFTSYDDITPYIGVPLTTFEDGMSSIADYIENGPPPDDPVWVNKPLVIPQGYTAVINTTNMSAGKGGFRLRANTGNLGNSNLWRDIFGNDNVQSGQAIYHTNTPVTSYDFDDYPQLTWSPYEYSLLRATAYEYIGEATTSYTYTYIFNPIQGNATSIKNGQNTNSYITLYMNDQFDGTVKLYPLTSMAAVGQGQTIDVGNDESENAGSGDISNGTWTNNDGNVFTPPQGGGNGTGSSQNPLEAIAGTVEHLGEVLNQFVAGLSTILTAPVEAIQTLINNGSAFVSQLSGLYSWLPAQVYNTLTSAIILCITVGVLKVLL